MNVNEVLKWRWLWGLVLWVASVATAGIWISFLNDPQVNKNWIIGLLLYVVGFLICLCHILTFRCLIVLGAISRPDKDSDKDPDDKLKLGEEIAFSILTSLFWPMYILGWPFGLYLHLDSDGESEETGNSGPRPAKA